MRGRGPRGMPRGNPQLVPIAWGSVGWTATVPAWLSAGGELGAAPAAAGGGPTTTVLQLARAHDPQRIHVQVTSNTGDYAYEQRSYRQPNALVIVTLDDAVDFSVVVFEEV